MAAYLQSRALFQVAGRQLRNSTVKWRWPIRASCFDRYKFIREPASANGKLIQIGGIRHFNCIGCFQSLFHSLPEGFQERPVLATSSPKNVEVSGSPKLVKYLQYIMVHRVMYYIRNGVPNLQVYTFNGNCLDSVQQKSYNWVGLIAASSSSSLLLRFNPTNYI